MNIRELRITDKDNFFALVSEFKSWVVSFEEFFEAAMKPPYSCVYVMEIDVFEEEDEEEEGEPYREIIGMVRVYEDMKPSGVSIRMEDLFVSERFHGKGFGKYLLDGIIKIYKDQEVAHKLNVVTFEENIGFFESLGFEKSRVVMQTFF